MNKKIIFVGCVKNITGYNNAFKNTIEETYKTFDNVSFYLIESDSNDDTINILNEFKNNHKNFNFISLGNLSRNITKRTERIAYCRNKYLEYIYKNSIKYDLLCVLDMDNDFKYPNKKITTDILNKFLKDENCYGITCNTPTYYDIWALRDNECKSDCWIRIRYDVIRGIPLQLSKENNIKKYQKKINVNNKWEIKKSAFNGLAFYKINDLLEYKPIYCGSQKFGKEYYELCEHVHFHDLLNKTSKKYLMFAPNLLLDGNNIAKEHII